jgi:hypothetical protein
MEQKTKVIYIIIYFLCVIFMPPVGMILFVSSITDFLAQNSRNKLVNIIKIPNQQLMEMSRRIAERVG